MCPVFFAYMSNVSDLCYDKNKTIKEYLIYWIFKLGFFCSCFGYTHDTNQYTIDHDLGHADIW